MLVLSPQHHLLWSKNFNHVPRGLICEWCTQQERAILLCNLSVKSYTSISSLFTIYSIPCARNNAASLQVAHQSGRPLSRSLSAVPYPKGNHSNNFRKFENLTRSPPLFLKKVTAGITYDKIDRTS